MKTNSDNVPAEMKAARRWILHDEQKRPKNPVTGNGNDWQLPQNWMTFQDAAGACSRYGMSGLGFVTGDGWTGIDLDHVIQERGAAAGALEIVRSIGSYAEVSPSGDGIHIFVKVDPSTELFSLNGKSSKLYPDAQIDISDVTDSLEGKESHIEAYHGNHYLTVTGNVFNDCRSLAENTTAVLDLVKKRFTPHEYRSEMPAATFSALSAPSSSDHRPEDYVDRTGAIDWKQFDSDALYEALNAIDPAYLEDVGWWKICAAAQEAGIPYSVIDAWSARDAARYNADENLKRIRSAKGKGLGTDAGGLIIQMAKESFGWQDWRTGDLKKRIGALAHQREETAAFEAEVAAYSASREKNAPPVDKGAALDWDDWISEEGDAAPESENIVAAPPVQEEAAPSERPAICNEAVLASDAEIVYICSTPEDADAINAAGGAAVSISDDANLVRDYLRTHTPTAILAAALRDEKKSRTLYSELKKTDGIEAAILPTARLAGEHETIAAAGAAGADVVREALCREAAGIMQPDGLQYYFTAGGMVEDLRNFHQVARFGFLHLDMETGGIYCGNLVTIGAATSIGKSTFCMQVADNIATAGGHVIYYSLEMSKLEMVTKCLSRRLYQSGVPKGAAFSALEIRKGAKSPDLTRVTEQFQKDVGNRLSIIGDDRLTVDRIISQTKSYIRRNHAVPLIIVDYLQLLRPARDTVYRDERKQLDEAIQDLKHLALDYGTAVILVSGFNRQNNLAPVTHEAFAETSGIEKTSDFVAGLELAVMETEAFKDDDEKKKIKKRDLVKAAAKEKPRKMILSVLKNRQADMTGKYLFSYDTVHDYFRECGDFGDRSEPDGGGRAADQDILLGARGRVIGKDGKWHYAEG